MDKPDFVRSQDELALDSEKATGIRLTYDEVMEIFGQKIIDEVYDYGSAIIVCNREEPAKTLRTRREALGYSQDLVANLANLSTYQVVDCEDSGTASPIRNLIAVATVLGLDPRYISWVPNKLAPSEGLG